MLAEGIVGPRTATDGSPASQRYGRDSSQCVQDSHAHFQEAVERGNVYCASNTAAVTVGATLTATNITYSLTNPAGSGVRLVLWRACVGIVTSTTAGVIMLAGCIATGAAAVVHGTPITSVINCKLGSNTINTGNKGLVDSASTAPSAPLPLRVLGFMPVTATASTGFIDSNLDGEFQLMPGTSVYLQGLVAVGTAVFSMTWEEIPL